MKKNIVVKGILLSIGLIVLGVVVLAQDKEKKKEKKSSKGPTKLEIIIENGDTLINGKSIKKMSKAEREQLEFIELAEMAPLASDKQIRIYKREHDQAMREHARGMEEHERQLRKLDQELGDIDRYIIIKSDVDGKTYEYRSGSGDDSYEFDVRGPMAPGFPIPPAAMAPGHMEFHFSDDFAAPSAQVFSYRNGDKNIQLRMSKASKEELSAAKINSPAESDIQLLANPMKNELSLSYQFNQGGSASLKVFDENGKQIKSESLVVDKSGYAEKNYPLTDFGNGKYFVEFALGSEKIVRKLIIKQ